MSETRSAVQRDVMRAVRDAEPSRTGAVKLSQVMLVLEVRARRLTWVLSHVDVDRALQALRRAGDIEYTGRRDPRTGKPRSRWGWVVAAPTDRRTFKKSTRKLYAKAAASLKDQIARRDGAAS